MSLYYANGSRLTVISLLEMENALKSVFAKLGERNNVCILPPDFTRFNSHAGELTSITYDYYGDKIKDIMPALGTHKPMSDWQLDKMFIGVPHELFREHDWRNDVVTIGEVPQEFVSKVTDGIYNKPWPCQLNKLVWEGNHDLILSYGQVVPHEVVGMANYTKNLFVGIGGAEGINESHFIGAAYGMEKMMGRANTPLRKILNYGYDNFCSHLPIIFALTVMGTDYNGDLVMRGLFIGDDVECFEKAAELSLEVNFQLLNKDPYKVVVYLDPEEFHSTWLGNKSIYRTRMALPDNAELIVLAPGVRMFGEDEDIDRLIRKYGYRTTPEIMKFLEENEDLAGNLSAAAHLIHGSSEGRFKIIYCPGELTREEICGVGYEYADLQEMLKLYDPEELKDGWNTIYRKNGSVDRLFYISNPALGLWAHERRFDSSK